MKKYTVGTILIAVAMMTGSAFAVENGPSATSPSAGGLGIDMTAVGTTQETRMAFWAKMKPEDQASVVAKCKDEQAMKGFSTDESTFCELTKKN